MEHRGGGTGGATVGSRELGLLPCPRRVDLAARSADHAGSEGTAAPLFFRDGSIPKEGYRISIDADGAVSVASSDEAGAFYARATLAQMERVFDPEGLPEGTVEDWPDLEVRGVMLDVSRTKVPTLETLFGIVDRLASWKLNHLELYMEHTYAYREHADAWEGADPYTSEDMERLTRYCAERHMELVANQNTLGHMERWLRRDRYAALGIASGVVSGPLGMPFPASTLDPANPRSLVLVRELIGELGSVVRGDRFHVGLDEPWELPRERSAEWGEWLHKLRAAPELAGREVLVWGDVLAVHPELLSEFPDGVTVCDWGYEANHPFAARSQTLADAGIDHWLSPGTSSWLSILGRTTNAIDGCRAAATAASAGSSGSAASGMLVTDWGDFGHLQYLPVSDPGLAGAAALSWCESSNRHLDAASVGGLLDVHCFEDPERSLGAGLVELGDVSTLVPCQFPNISTVVLHLYMPQMPVGSGLTTGLGPEHLEVVEGAISDAVEAIGRAKPRSDHGALAVEEMENSARLVLVACTDARERLKVGGRLSDVAAADRARLAADLGEVITEHRRLWSRRNRDGGLDESCGWLEHLRHCYLTGDVDPKWAGPLVDELRRRGSGAPTRAPSKDGRAK